MQYTKNLQLSKPSYDDDVDIQVLNNNMDILDHRIGDLPYLPLAGGQMKGNIWLNQWVGFKYGDYSELNFGNVDNKEVVNVKSDIFQFTTKQSNHVFSIESNDVTYNGDSLIRDLWTQKQDFIGYTKMSTGVIIQWGYVNPDSNDGNIQNVTLPTPMPTPNYAVFLSRSNFTQSTQPNMNTPSNTASYNCTRTSFNVVCPRKDRGNAVFWLVIGG